MKIIFEIKNKLKSIENHIDNLDNPKEKGLCLNELDELICLVETFDKNK